MLPSTIRLRSYGVAVPHCSTRPSTTYELALIGTELSLANPCPPPRGLVILSYTFQNGRYADRVEGDPNDGRGHQSVSRRELRASERGGHGHRPPGAWPHPGKP